MGLIFTGFVVVAILMFALWLVYLVTGKAELVDVGWAGGLGIIGIIYFIHTGLFGLRRWILLAALLLWSMRLVSLLLIRIYNGWKDPRYVYLESIWDVWKFLGLFELQAVLAAALSLPFFFAFTSEVSFGAWDVMALFLFVIGMGGVDLADQTLMRFKQNPENQGKVCKDGLWLYTRHPNYFFEIVIWISYALFGITASFGFVGFIAPAIIAYFILYITGIPPTEKQLLESKGEAYEEYIRTTSPLIPLPPKK